jgi:hypothetical protein
MTWVGRALAKALPMAPACGKSFAIVRAGENARAGEHARVDENARVGENAMSGER